MTKNFYQEAIDNFKKGVSYTKTLFDNARKIENQKLDSEEYESFLNLIGLVEENSQKSNIRTKGQALKIMKDLAYVKRKDTNLPIIDLAVGFGGIINGMDGFEYCQDINQDFLSVAKVVANQSNNKADTFKVCDSIKEPLPNNGKGIFIFDPPMGINRDKPRDWGNISEDFNLVTEDGKVINTEDNSNILVSSVKLNNMVGAENINKKSPTEILFIINFLLTAKDDAYFIALVPETFLTRNIKEYNNLRRYLIKHSLISVIKPYGTDGINTVVLFGQKERKNTEKISLRSLFKNIPDNINIFENKIKENDYAEISYIDLENHDYDSENYIRLPVKIKEREKLRSVKYIINDIKSLELDLKPLRVKIMKGYLIQYSNNDKDDKKEEELFWFQKGAENAINSLFRDGKITLSKDDKEVTVRASSFEDLKNIYELYKEGRIKKQEKTSFIAETEENRLFLINIEENLEKKYSNDKDFWEVINLIDGKIEEVLSFVDEFSKNLYISLVKYQCINIPPDNDIIENKSEVLRALKILEKLNLINIEDKVDTTKSFYEKYIPFYPFNEGDIS